MQQHPVTLSQEESWTPTWVHDAIFYQIFPDRFAQSAAVPKPSNLEPWDAPPTLHGFKGGDLVGIAEHLDYLHDLGITALYLTPIFRSTANHRYHTHDYYLIDPILGGNEALATLLQEAHSRDMKVVLDGVFNHASRGFFQFSDILENGSQSPYIDWFTVYSWPLHPYPEGDESPGYACWWNLPGLPKFNTSTQGVREFLWDVGEYWIRQGIDGWRLDVPGEINDDEFWREFRHRVKGVNPEAYIVGEIWDDARRWLQGDQFDAVMNYLFTKACLGFFIPGKNTFAGNVVEQTGLAPLQPLDARGFRQTIDSLIGMYSWPATLAQLNLLDSHDTPRYLTVAGGDEASLRLAMLFMMTFPGAPCIYYGDEIGMEGGRDPDSRRSFPWDRSHWNEDLCGYVKRCIELRRSHPVLRSGAYQSLYAEGDLYVFARTLGTDVAIIGLNAGENAQTVDVQIPVGGKVTDVRGAWDEPGPRVTEGTIRNWEIAARSGTVLLGHVV